MVSLGDLCWVAGLIVVIKGLYHLLSFVYAFTIRAPINVKKYGQWAVVTGATDGIGKAYCHELAKRGMNVCLVSRSKEKLTQEAAVIAEKFKVQTKTISFDFGVSDNGAYTALSNQLRDIEVGMLVNNVGISYDYPMYLEELPQDRIEALINLNIRSLTILTQLVLKGMLERKRGAIINISSISAMAPMPLLAVYAGTKAYVERFSTSLYNEYISKGIFVQCVAPGIVVSNMSKVRKPSMMIPLPNAFARSALNTVGYDKVTAGYWSHQIQTFVLTNLPEFIAVKSVFDMHASQRKRALAKQQKAQ
ncbi:hypothetical protein SAMD00019534_093310 [Acytostelium subglobosum LB1]|uniref:hypothetical protein n=1 Tax=Acytostelium subglobosum LB1 TaxID=1410327 RepID=UPI0006449038|nr:hypothetical protein SAMD00019534_093310 [Acytostelium subglobosum LB1]GAM26156.1 hypothetical protein SAMD00019534_093310 [Acytostelium subglobosum LB1]|eukprot:XP_012750710.1 hypothetical protein SAMD00019534_093310 [Acytostelium subglobosum LB1]